MIRCDGTVSECVADDGKVSPVVGLGLLVAAFFVSAPRDEPD